MAKPCNTAGVAAEEQNSASSLVQASPKRNTPRNAAGLGVSQSRLSATCPQYFGLESDLFDRNREAPDQPCDFVQLLRIMNLDGSREPNEAFVVAHRGYVVRNDRWHRPDMVGMDI
jgi:hypothetical protein